MPSRAATPATAASNPSTEFLTGQRGLLEDERQKILTGLADAEQDLSELRDRNDVAEVDFSEEGGEGASTASERGHIEALRSQLLVRLQAVDDAVARLDAGAYGVCQACGGPIGEARLEAMPDATLCVSCKSAPWTARRA